jgi:hypothetical protein
MPTALRGQALLDWMKTRKTAQEKLSNYLSEASRFIGRRGEDGTINTVQDWMDLVESRKAAPEQAQPETGLKTINTQAEYDALPSGAEFIDSADGKKYRKP